MKRVSLPIAVFAFAAVALSQATNPAKQSTTAGAAYDNFHRKA